MKSSGYIWGSVAVLFWSLSASVGGYLTGSADYFQIVLLMQGAAIVSIASIVILTKNDQLTKVYAALVNSNTRASLFRHVLTMSLFITIYHLAFYYAIQNAPRIQANIINYLWPLLLFIVSSTLIKTTNEKISAYDASLVFLAFIGAFSIAWDPTQPINEEMFSLGLLSATIAAFSAPIYMATSVVISRTYNIKSHVPYLLAFIFSLPILLIISMFRMQPIIPSDSAAIGLIIWLGVASVAIAHYSWTRALDEGPTVSIANLAYLVPILSTLFLIILLGDSPSPKILFGAALIIVANLLSNEAFRKIRAESSALVAFFFVSFLIYFREELYLDKLVFGSIPYLGELFAIVSGFFLARMWQKTSQEQDTLVSFSTEFDSFIDALRDPQTNQFDERSKEAIDNLIVSISDFDSESSSVKRALASEGLKNSLENVILLANQSSDIMKANTLRLRSLLNSWIVQKFDKASTGEVAIISLLGVTGVLLVLSSNSDNVAVDLVHLVFAACIAYIVFKIRDYNNMITISDYSKLLIVQSALRKIGQMYYIPDRRLIYSAVRPQELGTAVRYKENGKIVAIRSEEAARESLDDYYRSRVTLMLLVSLGVTSVLALLLEKYS